MGPFAVVTESAQETVEKGGQSELHPNESCSTGGREKSYADEDRKSRSFDIRRAQTQNGGSGELFDVRCRNVKCQGSIEAERRGVTRGRRTGGRRRCPLEKASDRDLRGGAGSGQKISRRPGRRFMTVSDFATSRVRAGERSSTGQEDGRPQQQRPTQGRARGRQQAPYRIIDFKSVKDGVPAKRADDSVHPNRSANIDCSTKGTARRRHPRSGRLRAAGRSVGPRRTSAGERTSCRTYRRKSSPTTSS